MGNDVAQWWRTVPRSANPAVQRAERIWKLSTPVVSMIILLHVDHREFIVRLKYSEFWNIWNMLIALFTHNNISQIVILINYEFISFMINLLFLNCIILIINIRNFSDSRMHIISLNNCNIRSLEFFLNEHDLSTDVSCLQIFNYGISLFRGSFYTNMRLINHWNREEVSKIAWFVQYSLHSADIQQTITSTSYSCNYNSE